LVSVTVSAALVDPTLRLTNVSFAGVIVTGADPVPLRLTVWGLFDELSVNVSMPVRGPTAVGENVTPTAHFAPPLMLALQVLVAIAKFPVATILVKVSAVFW